MHQPSAGGATRLRFGFDFLRSECKLSSADQAEKTLLSGPSLSILITGGGVAGGAFYIGSFFGRRNGHAAIKSKHHYVFIKLLLNSC
jgi:hypothetical protein